MHEPHDAPYFYTRPDQISAAGLIMLDESEAHHCTKVMRRSVGDQVYVVDGEGNEYLTRIDRIDRARVDCSILEHQIKPRELELDLTLGLAMLKKDRMAWALEKATELGVNHFAALQTERSIAKSSDNKSQRWKTIVLNAMKQSRRAVLPSVDAYGSMKEFMSRSSEYPIRILLAQSAKTAIGNLRGRVTKGATEKCLVLVGPEGDFSTQELNLADEHGFLPVTLGTRRLRSETAAIISIALITEALLIS